MKAIVKLGLIAFIITIIGMSLYLITSSGAQSSEPTESSSSTMKASTLINGAIINYSLVKPPECSGFTCHFDFILSVSENISKDSVQKKLHWEKNNTPLLDYTILYERNVSYTIEKRVDNITCSNVVEVNGTWKVCTSNPYTELVDIWELRWIEFDDSFEKGKTYKIRIVGKVEPGTGIRTGDAVPELAGFKFSEFSWLLTDYNKRRELFAQADGSYTNVPVNIWLNDSDIDDCREVAYTSGDDANEVDATTAGINLTSKSQANTNCNFDILINTTSSANQTVGFFYYNQSGTNTYKLMSFFDRFDDNTLNKWDVTNDKDPACTVCSITAENNRVNITGGVHFYVHIEKNVSFNGTLKFAVRSNDRVGLASWAPMGAIYFGPNVNFHQVLKRSDPADTAGYERIGTTSACTIFGAGANTWYYGKLDVASDAQTKSWASRAGTGNGNYSTGCTDTSLPSTSNTVQKIIIGAGWGNTNPDLDESDGSAGDNPWSSDFDNIGYFNIDNFNVSNDAPVTRLGPEEQSTADESGGDSAIEQGIRSSVIGPNAVIYTDQQVYERYLNTSQRNATFDKFTLNGTKRWAINYVTTGENFANMLNMTPSLYILEMQNMSSSGIRTRVSGFINVTNSE